MVALMIGMIVLCAAYVACCDRIIGRTDTGATRGADAARREPEEVA